MSTNEGGPVPGAAALTPEVSGVPGPGAAPQGLDLAGLTRLANEMFRALPAGALPRQEPGAPAFPAAASLPAAPMGLPASSHGPLPSVATIPTETDLRSTPALTAGVMGLAATSGSPRTPLPGVPGFPGEADLKSLLGMGVVGDPLAGAVAPAGVGTPTDLYFLEGRDAAPAASTEVPGAEPPVAVPSRSPEVVPQAPLTTPGFFDAASLKRDFPILSERVHGRPLVWLDNAATTQKPRAVIDRLASFYAHENSNVHRAAHVLAARATDAYEGAREKVRRFLNADSAKQIVFVRGTTEGVNLLSQSWGRRWIGSGDEIILTHLEHHSNIVPWQLLCAASGAKLKVAPVDDSGQILLDAYERLFTPRTKLVAATQVSNALGTILPAAEMIEVAHRYGAKFFLDGAQAVSHLRIDVQALDCDAFVFSGHKVFGPTGIGAVYGKPELLDSMPPWQGGGNMISDVTFERTVYQPPPMRFEAGTGNIADAVGLGAALDYLTGVGLENVARHEHELLVYATKRLLEIPGLQIIGTAPDKAGVLSFVMDGHRTEDIGRALDAEGIAVRAGHHCAQPALRRFGLESSVRASLALYNTCEDIDALAEALRHLQASQ